ncbi:uncharacterized protein BDR25DRAFT_362456 [Lindgomyces ingoldianus]|uniref:Uncharacterized protein n=1 Tax=Lindgomyces ingoldianus TaxID=673940 RepID=A0ACB6QB08_9PLEO|nr:uncharacterized protein BDR25DRAFT_362456 [Lindgomyces ingoldianus]KAF2463778.1 hypothetical protein BDR25DRAFT_362456 [Lindgomyces ingoldianus]
MTPDNDSVGGLMSIKVENRGMLPLLVKDLEPIILRFLSASLYASHRPPRATPTSQRRLKSANKLKTCPRKSLAGSQSNTIHVKEIRQQERLNQEDPRRLRSILAQPVEPEMNNIKEILAALNRLSKCQLNTSYMKHGSSFGLHKLVYHSVQESSSQRRRDSSSERNHGFFSASLIISIRTNIQISAIMKAWKGVWQLQVPITADDWELLVHVSLEGELCQTRLTLNERVPAFLNLAVPCKKQLAVRISTNSWKFCTRLGCTAKPWHSKDILDAMRFARLLLERFFLLILAPLFLSLFVGVWHSDWLLERVGFTERGSCLLGRNALTLDKSSLANKILVRRHLITEISVLQNNHSSEYRRYPQIQITGPSSVSRTPHFFSTHPAPSTFLLGCLQSRAPLEAAPTEEMIYPLHSLFDDKRSTDTHQPRKHQAITYEQKTGGWRMEEGSSRETNILGKVQQESGRLPERPPISTPEFLERTRDRSVPRDMMREEGGPGLARGSTGILLSTQVQYIGAGDYFILRIADSFACRTMKRLLRGDDRTAIAYETLTPKADGERRGLIGHLHRAGTANPAREVLGESILMGWCSAFRTPKEYISTASSGANRNDEVVSMLHVAIRAMFRRSCTSGYMYGETYSHGIPFHPGPECMSTAQYTANLLLAALRFAPKRHNISKLPQQTTNCCGRHHASQKSISCKKRSCVCWATKWDIKEHTLRRSNLDSGRCHEDTEHSGNPANAGLVRGSFKKVSINDNPNEQEFLKCFHSTLCDPTVYHENEKLMPPPLSDPNLGTRKIPYTSSGLMRASNATPFMESLAWSSSVCAQIDSFPVARHSLYALRRRIVEARVSGNASSIITKTGPASKSIFHCDQPKPFTGTLKATKSRPSEGSGDPTPAQIPTMHGDPKKPSRNRRTDGPANFSPTKFHRPADYGNPSKGRRKRHRTITEPENVYRDSQGSRRQPHTKLFHDAWFRTRTYKSWSNVSAGTSLHYHNSIDFMHFPSIPTEYHPTNTKPSCVLVKPKPGSPPFHCPTIFLDLRSPPLPNSDSFSSFRILSSSRPLDIGPAGKSNCLAENGLAKHVHFDKVDSYDYTITRGAEGTTSRSRYEPIHCTYNTIAKNQFVVRSDGADFMRFLLAGMERKSRAILKTVGYCKRPIWSHQPSRSASPQTSPPKKAYTSRNTIYFSGLSTIQYDSETHYDSTMHVIVTYRILRIVVLPVGHAESNVKIFRRCEARRSTRGMRNWIELIARGVLYAYDYGDDASDHGGDPFDYYHLLLYILTCSKWHCLTPPTADGIKSRSHYPPMTEFEANLKFCRNHYPSLMSCGRLSAECFEQRRYMLPTSPEPNESLTVPRDFARNLLLSHIPSEAAQLTCSLCGKLFDKGTKYQSLTGNIATRDMGAIVAQSNSGQSPPESDPAPCVCSGCISRKIYCRYGEEALRNLQIPSATTYEAANEDDIDISGLITLRPSTPTSPGELIEGINMFSQLASPIFDIGIPPDVSDHIERCGSRDPNARLQYYDLPVPYGFLQVAHNQFVRMGFREANYSEENAQTREPNERNVLDPNYRIVSTYYVEEGSFPSLYSPKMLFKYYWQGRGAARDVGELTKDTKNVLWRTIQLEYERLWLDVCNLHTIRPQTMSFLHRCKHFIDGELEQPDFDVPLLQSLNVSIFSQLSRDLTNLESTNPSPPRSQIGSAGSNLRTRHCLTSRSGRTGSLTSLGVGGVVTIARIMNLAINLDHAVTCISLEGFILAPLPAKKTIWEAPDAKQWRAELDLTIQAREIFGLAKTRKVYTMAGRFGPVVMLAAPLCEFEQAFRDAGKVERNLQTPTVVLYSARPLVSFQMFPAATIKSRNNFVHRRKYSIRMGTFQKDSAYLIIMFSLSVSKHAIVVLTHQINISVVEEIFTQLISQRPFQSFHTQAHSLSQYPSLSLTGEDIVITVRSFTEAGATHIAILDRTESKLHSTSSAIAAIFTAVKIWPYVVDVTKKTEVGKAFTDFASEAGTLDVLVSNASYGALDPPIRLADLNNSFSGFGVSLKGAFIIMRAFLHSAKDAALLNVSVLAILQGASVSAYAVSKATSIHFFGIRASVKCGYKDELKSGVPCPDDGHVDVMNGADLAITSPPDDFMVWLAGPEADFLKGKLEILGGMTLQMWIDRLAKEHADLRNRCTDTREWK